MRHNRRAFSVYLLLLIVLLFPRISLAAEKHFLWRATSGDLSIYLLGSIHFMKPRIYPLSPVITDAFDKCDALAVEADINSVSGNILQKIRTIGFYQPPDSIVNHISRQTYGYIRTEVSRLGFPLAAINSQKPWLLGITLSSIELIRSGYNPDYGIDRYFLTAAAGKKKIIELESLEYQIDLLANLPDEEQESFLLCTVKDLKSLVEQVDSITAAWQNGDAAALASMLEKSVEDDDNLKKIYKKIMTDRNRNMAEKIVGYLTNGQRVFIVVGAGHMVGNEGILELLNERGFKVEQL
ncbi:MAG: TraB/GumN family protein [Syntrophorhabdaceae bacterium]